MSIIEKLKSRWGVKNSVQVILILIVFACTGYSVILLKHLIGISSESSVGTRTLFYIAVLPIYNLMLLMYGFIFGQFEFFLNFEKRFFGRIVNVFKKKSN
jgi:hypothetical protein